MLVEDDAVESDLLLEELDSDLVPESDLAGAESEPFEEEDDSGLTVEEPERLSVR